jgi:6-phosphogluconolactonase (cycloisomerase 2 family)
VLRRLAPFAALGFGLLALTAGQASAANLYTLNYGGPPETIRGFARAADGSLSALPGSPFTLPPGAPSGVIALAFTPDGGTAVTTYLFNGGIRGHTVGSDGSIATPPGPTLTPSIQGLAVSPDGRFAYAPTRDFMAEAAVGIVGYSIGADGSLTQLSGSPFGSGEFREVAITPDGRFLYAGQGAQLKHFSIAADGSLTEAGTPTPMLERALAVSPDGRFLFAADDGAPIDTVTSFSIGADGNLSQNGMPAPAGGSQLGYFAVAPDGSRIYMPEAGPTGAIVTAAVGPDGTLSVTGSTPATNAYAVAVSPDGRFLYYASETVVGFGTIGPDGILTLSPSTVENDSGEPERIVFGPGPAPTASFVAIPGAPRKVSRFDASASTGAARFDWDFGDGTALPDGGPTPTHAYAGPGVYPVRLTVWDERGCSTQQIYTGQSTTCPGGSAPTTTATLDTLPTLTALSVTNSRFAVSSGRRPRVRRGTTFRYTLSEAAKVTFRIARRTIGRRVAGSCRPLTRRNRTRRKCVLFRRVGRITADAKQGKNRGRFSGKLRGRRLRPGRYRATAIATDAAGGQSAPRRVAFRIVRP